MNKTPYTVEPSDKKKNLFVVVGPTRTFRPSTKSISEEMADLLNGAYSEGLRDGAQGIEVKSPERVPERGLGTDSPFAEERSDAPKNNEEQSEDAALPDGRLSTATIDRIMGIVREAYAGYAPTGQHVGMPTTYIRNELRSIKLPTI